MIRRIQFTDVFTPQARRRWNKIPEWARRKILDNVFCVKCRRSGTIILETAQMKKGDLILRGKCADCGHDVCRLVEPECE
ncbi:MAG: hypothetical protein JW720_16225 [Sedimentisphaerales bacterium]|nr:hypothetical protein [Sedimentisphaerales bacterium]